VTTRSISRAQADLRVVGPVMTRHTPEQDRQFRSPRSSRPALLRSVKAKSAVGHRLLSRDGLDYRQKAAHEQE